MAGEVSIIVGSLICVSVLFPGGELHEVELHNLALSIADSVQTVYSCRFLGKRSSVSQIKKKKNKFNRCSAPVV